LTIAFDLSSSCSAQQTLECEEIHDAFAALVPGIAGALLA
jgi:hypothetical protein